MGEKNIIAACRYAVRRMIGQGSSSIALHIGTENQTIVSWKDVLAWLDKEEQNCISEGEK